MRIDFSDGEQGARESEALMRIAQTAIRNLADDADVQALANKLMERCANFELSSPAPDAGEVSWWRRLLGPSRVEETLSAQRVAALERAERAERSSFEALAETATVARERDQALQRIADLERQLADAPE